MAAKKPKAVKLNPQLLRETSGLKQADFWRRYGVTQSGGSRYEAGRRMPKPLRMLLALEQGQAAVAEIADGTLAARV